MKKVLLLMLSVSLLIVASCSKSKEEPRDVVCKVKFVEHLYTDNGISKSDKSYYTYDNQDRIIRIDLGKEQSTSYETFTYSINKVTWKNSDGDTEVYNLDASGKITSASQGSDLLNFKYNSEGQLIETRVGADVETYTYTGGDLGEVFYNGKLWSTFSATSSLLKNDIVYTFLYADKFLDFDEIGMRIIPFIGKKSTHIPVMVLTDSGTANQIKYAYTYSGDSNGNITGATIVKTQGQTKTTEEYKFTYECK